MFPRYFGCNKNLSFIIFIFLIFLFNGKESIAWNNHAAFTMLSEDALREAHLYNEEVLKEGSNRPDHHRTLDHYTANKERAQNAFCGAVTPYREKNYSVAAHQIANSFHYLQDRGDPTKFLDDLLHGGRKDRVRNLTKDLLENTDDPLLTNKHHRYHSRFIETLQKEGIKISKYESRDDIFKKLQDTKEEKEKIIKDIILEEKKEGKHKEGKANKKIPEALIDSMAVIVACQNQWIVLLKEEAEGHSTGTRRCEQEEDNKHKSKNKHKDKHKKD
jgi:hypothetical protein